MRNGSKEGEYHCQATLAQLREKREKGRPGERRTSRHVTSPSLSSSGPVTSVRQKTQSRDRTRESPPETPKGRANPPKSYNNPPIVGPNREPTPLKDSANDVALPWRNIVLLRSHHSIYCLLPDTWFASETCRPAMVKAAGVSMDSPRAITILLRSSYMVRWFTNYEYLIKIESPKKSSPF